MLILLVATTLFQIQNIRAFDSVALARGRFEQMRSEEAEGIKASEMGSALFLFPAGRGDIRYSFGRSLRDDKWVLLKETASKGKVKVDWRLVLTVGKVNPSGTVGDFLRKEGYKPKGSLSPTILRDLTAARPFAVYETAYMAGNIYYWTIGMGSSGDSVKHESYEAQQEKPAPPYPITIEEVEWLWNRK